MTAAVAQAFVGVSTGLCIVAIVYGLVTLWTSR